MTDPIRMSRRAFTAGALVLLATTALTPWAGAQEARDVAEMSMGNPDAEVTVIEYASLTCPHCAAFHKEVFPQLKATFIDTGKIHFIFREIYFDRAALWGAMLARCAGEDRYFGVVDVLFEQQAGWSRRPDAPAIMSDLYAFGRQAGLTREAMDACMSDQAWAQSLVETYQKNAQADGISATPTFIINGEKTSNLPWPELEARINAALGS
jgi:protein-disulfide isomerase